MDFVSLIPSFGNFAFTILAFVVALMVIVFVHEFGHYIVGRWTGIQAEVFSIGFGPALWSRPDRRGTRWQIAAIPLGGYVKFVGDGDPASVTAAPDADGATMRNAPLWARAATVAAGPVFNFILSIVIFAGLFMARGVATEPLTIADMPPVPFETGLQVGDAILAIDGRPTPPLAEFGDFANQLPAHRLLSYRVQRGQTEVDVMGPHPYPPFVSAVSPESAAADARLRVGDWILAVEGEELGTFSQLQARVAAANGAPLNFTIWRDGQTLNVTLTPRPTDLPRPEGGFEKRWLIGISGGLWFEPATASPGLGTSLARAVDQTFFVIEASVSGLYHMIAGDISSCNLRGPIGIAQTSGTVAAQGLFQFIGFIALLSTAVGLLNLFPIPILDGGHLVFYAYEALAGRPPSEGAMRIIMSLGLAVIVTLMVFALSNDILCP